MENKNVYVHHHSIVCIIEIIGYTYLFLNMDVQKWLDSLITDTLGIWLYVFLLNELYTVARFFHDPAKNCW